VRRKPYSVILFDEVEKAHPSVFNVLLQVGVAKGKSREHMGWIEIGSVPALPVHSSCVY
jgi:hypothetical protein